MFLKKTLTLIMLFVVMFIFIGYGDSNKITVKHNWYYDFTGEVKKISVSESGKYIFVNTKENNKSITYILDNKGNVILNNKTDIISEIEGIICDSRRIVAYRDLNSMNTKIVDFSNNKISEFIASGMIGFWQEYKYFYDFMDIDNIFMRINEVSTGKKIFDLYEYKKEMLGNILDNICDIKLGENGSILIYEINGVLTMLEYKNNVAIFKWQYKTHDYFAFINRIGFTNNKILVSISKENLSGEILCLDDNKKVLWKKKMPYCGDIHSSNGDYFISSYSTKDKEEKYSVIAIDHNGKEIWKYSGNVGETIHVKTSKSNTVLEVRKGNERDIMCFSKNGEIIFKKRAGKNTLYDLSINGNELIFSNEKKLEYYDFNKGNTQDNSR